MAIEIIGGSEFATPTQAKVMMFGFAPSSWQVTKTTGVTKSALVGFKLFLDIFPSNASSFSSSGRQNKVNIFLAFRQGFWAGRRPQENKFDNVANLGCLNCPLLSLLAVPRGPQDMVSLQIGQKSV
jgi:hypothetical protein